VSTTTDAREKLIESLRDPEYRHHFASALVRRGIAEQLRETRLSRGWTQERLARESGKVQETISQLEDPNYGRYTHKTLERLARALDVGLMVKLVPFSELADWVSNLSPEDMAVPDFEHDPGLSSTSEDREVATRSDYVQTVSLPQSTRSAGVLDLENYRRVLSDSTSRMALAGD
jgi:transcriptional regulator with XRE-family HTH domain